VLWPGWTQVVEEHPAAVLVGVKKDRGAALRTTRIRIDETAADGARQVALEKADGIALMHVFKKLRPIGPGPAALIDAPPAPAIRIVVEAGHPKPRTSSEVKVDSAREPGPPPLHVKSASIAGLDQPYPNLARTQLAGRRVDFASGLGRLRDSRKSGAVAGGAFGLGRRFIGFQIVHGNHFLDKTPTASMSLCITDCWLRLSHFKVTPDQLVSVTVAWSFLSSRQQTREPTPNDLDSEPVIRVSVSVVLLALVTVAS
jgi:hypothetical protein